MTPPPLWKIAVPILAALGLASRGPAQTALRAGTWLGSDGVESSAPVLLLGGTRARLRAAPPRGVAVRDFGPDSYLTPGLVDAWSRVGLVGGDDESGRAFAPEVRAAPAFAPDEGVREACLAAGVTTLIVAPGEENVLGGRAAEVHWTGEGWRITAEDAGLVASLTAASRKEDRAPTSLAGQVRALRERLPELGCSKHGGIAWIRVDEPAELLGAAELAAMPCPRIVAVGAPAWREGLVVPQLVVSGLAPGSDPAALRTPGELARRGARLGFGSGAQGPWKLRPTALEAVRRGLDPVAAFSALTAPLGWTPSEESYVVWSSHPLRGDARVLAVVARGEVVWEEK